MNCPFCGKKNPDNARFCINCGENIEQFHKYLFDNNKYKVILNNLGNEEISNENTNDGNLNTEEFSRKNNFKENNQETSLNSEFQKRIYFDENRNINNSPNYNEQNKERKLIHNNLREDLKELENKKKFKNYYSKANEDRYIRFENKGNALGQDGDSFLYSSNSSDTNKDDSFRNHVKEDVVIEKAVNYDDIIDRDEIYKPKSKTKKIFTVIILLLVTFTIVFGAFKAFKYVKNQSEIANENRKKEAAEIEKQKEISKQKAIEEEKEKQKQAEAKEINEYLKKTSSLEILLKNQEDLFYKNIDKIKSSKDSDLFKKLNLDKFFNDLLKTKKKDPNIIAMNDNSKYLLEKFDAIDSVPNKLSTLHENLSNLVLNQSYISESFLSSDKTTDYDNMMENINSFVDALQAYEDDISSLKAEIGANN